MNRKLGIGLAAMMLGAVGCGSTTNTTITYVLDGGLSPSVSAVIPESAFLARTRDITISGFDTNWTSKATVNFGIGVVINKMTVASATALVVNITIADNATTGPRDVVVTDESGAKQTYKGAFKVESPIDVTFQGIVAQGSAIVLKVQNRDVEHVFDTTSTGGGFFGPPTFTNIQIPAPAGVTVQVSDVQPFSLSATVLIDVNAAPGPGDLDVASGPAGDPSVVHFPAPASLNIAARTATAVSAGSPTTGMVVKAFDSALYTFTPTAGTNILDFAATSMAMGAMPGIALLPKSGKFADLIGFNAATTLINQNADPYYLLYWDSSGTAGYSYTVTATSASPTVGTDTEPNNDKMHAQVAKLPFVVMGGVLESATDEDWYQFTAVMADVSMKVQVITLPGDRKTDTIVDVFQSDAMTSLGGPSPDTTYHENYVFPTAIAMAGTYYVKIYASPPPNFDPAKGTKYNAIIRLVK